MVVTPGLQNALAVVKAIIFDKDGTLADARLFLRKLAIARARACADAVALERPDQVTVCYVSLCQAFGVTRSGLDPDGLMAVGTRPANQQVATDLLVTLGWSPAQADNLSTQLFAGVDCTIASKAAQTPPFAGTQNMLQQLRLRCLKVGILSSDSSLNVKNFLNYYQLNRLVDDWQGTDAGTPPKPDPELFWQLCDRLQVRAADTLVVGDSWADLEVARNGGAAGFVSVGDKWGRSPVSEADHVIHDWSDLLRFGEGCRW